MKWLHYKISELETVVKSIQLRTAAAESYYNTVKGKVLYCRKKCLAMHMRVTDIFLCI